MIAHLCDSCSKCFETCDGKPVFGIDRDPAARGEKADIVIECPQHATKQPPRWDMVVETPSAWNAIVRLGVVGQHEYESGRVEFYCSSPQLGTKVRDALLIYLNDMENGQDPESKEAYLRHRLKAMAFSLDNCRIVAAVGWLLAILMLGVLIF